MYQSSDSSPSRSTTPLHALDDHGMRKFKPLPKRRRMMEFGSHGASLPYPLTTTHTSSTPSNATTINATAPDRGWSVTANFSDVDKVMNLTSSFTREQFIAHAGEFARRLQHQLQGGRLPSLTGDRMEFVQAFLQQHREHAAELPQSHPDSPRGSSDSEIQPPEESTTYSVSVPLPPLSPDAKFDLDAMFSAQFEASLASAVGSFDTFDECDVLPESWEEVAEIYYSHRPAPPPPSAPAPVPPRTTEVTSDLGRRGLRDGEEDEDEDGDGDSDHLRQPSNAKKRKTPANANNNWHSQTRGDLDEEIVGGNLGGSGGSKSDGAREGAEHDNGDQGANKGGYGSGKGGTGGGPGQRLPGSAHSPHSLNSLGRLPLSTLSSFASASPSSARVGQLKAIVRARGKLAGAMVAGVQHKEMLKTRKRQLEAVLGVLSSGSPDGSGTVGSPALDSTLNSLALDQALAMVGTSPLPMGDSAKPGLDSGAFADTGNGGFDGRQVVPHGGTKERVKNYTGPPVRLSKRTSARQARALAKTVGTGARLNAPLPTAQFTFKCDSVAKERTKAAQEEAIKLRQRFEAELERQAATAAKMAAASRAANAVEAASNVGAGSNSTGNSKAAKQRKTKTGASPSKNRTANSAAHGSAVPAPVLKPGGAAQQSAQQPQRQTQHQNTNKSSQKENANPQHQPGSQVPSPTTPSNKPKKKKRSAMANASNPHHLRNYVPSRLPHSGEAHGQGHGGLAGLLGPTPVRFLTAELPPRRGGNNPTPPSHTAAAGKKKGGGGNNGPGAALSPGLTDEWICMFCEYDLYYGDEVAFRRAVRGRKKVLKRRRRARERAAAAANGVKPYEKPAASAPPPPLANGTTGGNAVPPGQSEGEEEYDVEEDYDGDPGYQGGGSGRDEFGNLPKGQLNGAPAGKGGRGMEGHGGGARQMADPAG